MKGVPLSIFTGEEEGDVYGQNLTGERECAHASIG
jgi:hypothetical protein